MLHLTEAPRQLVEHCLGRSQEHPPVQSEFDPTDVAALASWLTEQGEFETHDEWVQFGMAAKLALGDDGLAIWRLTHDGTVTEAVERAKWSSFDSEPSANSVTLKTWLKRAHRLGWTGGVRKSLDSMFGGIAAVTAPSIVPVTSELPTFTASSLAGQPVPVREWHARDLMPAKTVTLLNGDGGTGKSLLALQLAVSTVTGRTWLNRMVQQGSCLFLTAEDAQDEVHRRLNDISREGNVPLAALTDLVISSLAGADALLAAPDGRSNVIAATPLFGALDAKVAELRPALVVLDTLADLFGGEENQRAQARQFVGLLRGLCTRYGATVLLLAHPSLSGMANGSGSSGSTGWNNSVRSRLYFDRIRGEGGFGEPDPDARVLRSMKSNYGRVGEEIVVHWRRGVFVPEHVSVAGMVAAHDERNRADEIFVKMLMLYREEGRGSVSPNPSVNYAPKVFATHAGAQGLKTHALKAAMDRLLASGRIQTVSFGPPSHIRQRLIVSQSCEDPLTNGASNPPSNPIPSASNWVPTPLPTTAELFQPPFQRPAVPTPIPPSRFARPDGAPRA